MQGSDKHKYKGGNMAAYRDLQERIARAGATCIYLSAPPQWFGKAVRAAAGVPVVVNVKGMGPDDTPVLVTLAELERLQAAARTVEELRVLAPDALGLPADGAKGLE